MNIKMGHTLKPKHSNFVNMYLHNSTIVIWNDHKDYTQFKEHRIVNCHNKLCQVNQTAITIIIVETFSTCPVIYVTNQSMRRVNLCFILNDLAN